MNILSQEARKRQAVVKLAQRKVRERAKLKQGVSRLVNILFPELEALVPSLHIAPVYAVLSEFPGAKQISEAHLTHLKTVLSDAMGAMILAEIGDFSRFDSPDKLLAYAGLSPSTYQSGKFKATGVYAHMEKRGLAGSGFVLPPSPSLLNTQHLDAACQGRHPIFVNPQFGA